MITGIDSQIQDWAAALGWPLEGMLRLFLAAMFGGLIGLEREVRGRQAGFRTNLLVCLGSAMAMLVSIQFALRPWDVPGVDNIQLDPARVAYGIMTGIGFLGAGTILQARGQVRGLTTAAALWCVAAIGLAIGFGMYTLSAVGVIFIVSALWLLNYLEKVIPKTEYRRITIRRRWEPGSISSTVQRFQEAGFKVSDVSFQRSGDMKQVDVTMQIRFTDRKAYYSLERELETDEQYELMAAHEG